MRKLFVYMGVCTKKIVESSFNFTNMFAHNKHKLKRKHLGINKQAKF